MDLSQEKDKTSRLEEHLAKVQQQKHQASEAVQNSPEKVVPDSSPVYHSTPASRDLHIRDLEQERDHLKGELSVSCAWACVCIITRTYKKRSKGASMAK